MRGVTYPASLGIVRETILASFFQKLLGYLDIVVLQWQ